MLAVSVQPPLQVNLEWSAREPPDPRRAETIQCIAVFLPVPASTQRPCNPPRSSGVLKRNSAWPEESPLPSAMTFDDSSQPPPPAATRLPVNVVQWSS